MGSNASPAICWTRGRSTLSRLRERALPLGHEVRIHGPTGPHLDAEHARAGAWSAAATPGPASWPSRRAKACTRWSTRPPAAATNPSGLCPSANTRPVLPRPGARVRIRRPASVARPSSSSDCSTRWTCATAAARTSRARSGPVSRWTSPSAMSTRSGRGDANSYALRALELCASPPAPSTSLGPDAIPCGTRASFFAAALRPGGAHRGPQEAVPAGRRLCRRAPAGAADDHARCSSWSGCARVGGAAGGRRAGRRSSRGPMGVSDAASRGGCVIPAHPLALDARRAAGRAPAGARLTRYYCAAGAGGWPSACTRRSSRSAIRRSALLRSGPLDRHGRRARAHAASAAGRRSSRSRASAAPRRKRSPRPALARDLGIRRGPAQPGRTARRVQPARCSSTAARWRTRSRSSASTSSLRWAGARPRSCVLARVPGDSARVVAIKGRTLRPLPDARRGASAGRQRAATMSRSTPATTTASWPTCSPTSQPPRQRPPLPLRGRAARPMVGVDARGGADLDAVHARAAARAAPARSTCWRRARPSRTPTPPSSTRATASPAASRDCTRCCGARACCRGAGASIPTRTCRQGRWKRSTASSPPIPSWPTTPSWRRTANAGCYAILSRRRSGRA